MKLDLAKLAAAGMLTLSAVSAQAGSVTQPGETVGIATGSPLAPGWYFIDTVDWGVRDTPGGNTALGVNIPVIAWSTPWKVWNARVQFLGAFPTLEQGVSHFDYKYGFYNPFFAGQLAWDLGAGWSFSYLLGGYVGVGNGIGFDSSSLNQRFAVSYTANGWNLTANLIYGTQLDTDTNPDFINLDLTATKKFGRWEVGAVGFFSTDLNVPRFDTNGRQSQFALGPLVGYYWDGVILQGYLTRDVAQSNYGGYDTRIWGRIIIPVPDVPPAPLPGPPYPR